MAIEMAGDDHDDAAPPPPPTGITIRAWYGVELVSLLACGVHLKKYQTNLPCVPVSSTSRGRASSGHFLAIKNSRARTPAPATEAGAGRYKLGASWPARHRVRSVVEVVKPMKMDRV